jgi:hypothetical protein
MNRVLKKQILLCVQDAKKKKEPSFRYRINRGGGKRYFFRKDNNARAVPA